MFWKLIGEVCGTKMARVFRNSVCSSKAVETMAVETMAADYITIFRETQKLMHINCIQYFVLPRMSIFSKRLKNILDLIVLVAFLASVEGWHAFLFCIIA